MKKKSINKPKLVEKDLDLFESINKGKEKHIEGSESLPPIKPLTKAYDVAYVRFSVPDLELYAKWIEDFGLCIMHQDDDVIISRGLLGKGFCHVAHRGPAKFLGFALEMNKIKDV